MASDSHRQPSPYQPKMPPAPRRPDPIADPKRTGPYDAGAIRQKFDNADKRSTGNESPRSPHK